jgi:chloride channel protein, CIC family
MNKKASLNSQEYRLLILSVVVGLAGGLAAQAFLWLLATAQNLLLGGIAGYRPPEPGMTDPVPGYGAWGLWLIPVVTALGGLFSGALSHVFAPEAEGEGTDSAVHALHYEGGKVKPMVPLVKAVASAITIGSGGAAGREGPAAQISVGLGSILSDMLHLPDEERRMIVLAGMAAGLAAMFKAPLGMAIFSVEVLYAGMAFESEVMIYTVTASVMAYAVSGLFSGWSPVFLFPETLHFTHPVDLIGYGFLGVIAGVIGAIEPPVYYYIRDAFKKLRLPGYLKPALGGLLMGLLALIAPETISTGYGWVQKAMTGGYTGWFLILLVLAEILAVSLTICSGGSGGIFGPNVYIGGMLGAWVAFVANKFLPLTHLAPSAYAAVGMGAVFAGTARVPIATLVMVGEMTGGYGLIVPSMLANSIAFVVQRAVASRFRYSRILEAQVELRKDSPTHHKNLVQAAFEVLQGKSSVNLGDLNFPELSALIRRGGSIAIGGGQARLFEVSISPGSLLAGRSVAEAFSDFRGLVAVAVIRDQTVLVPRGVTPLQAGDKLVIAVGDPKNVEVFKRAASDPDSQAK